MLENFLEKLSEYSWSESMTDDEEFSIFKDIISYDGDFLEFFPQKYRNNKEIVLIALTYYPYPLKFASEELKKDKDIFYAALDAQEGSIDVLDDANECLRDDKDFMKEMLKVDGNAFKYCSERLKNDEEMVALSIENYGSLEFAPDNFKKNKKFILKLVNISHNLSKDVFSHISEELRNDDDVINKFIKKDVRCYSFLKEDKKTKKLSNFVFGRYWFILKDLPTIFKTNKSFILKNLRKNDIVHHNFLKEIGFPLNEDKEIVELVMKNSNLNYEDVPFKLKLVEDISLYACDDFRNIPLIPKELLSNKSFVLKALDVNTNVFCSLPLEMQQDEDIVKKLIFLSPKMICYVNNNKFLTVENFEKALEDSGLYNLKDLIIRCPMELRSKKSFALNVMKSKNGGQVLNLFPDFINDPEVVLEAVKTYTGAIINMSNELKEITKNKDTKEVIVILNSLCIEKTLGLTNKKKSLKV